MSVQEGVTVSKAAVAKPLQRSQVAREGEEMRGSRLRTTKLREGRRQVRRVKRRFFVMREKVVVAANNMRCGLEVLEAATARHAGAPGGGKVSLSHVTPRFPANEARRSLWPNHQSCSRHLLLQINLND